MARDPHKNHFFLPLRWVGGGVENKSKPVDQSPWNRDSVNYRILHRITRRTNCDAIIELLPLALCSLLPVSVSLPSLSHLLSVDSTVGLLSLLSLFSCSSPCHCPGPGLEAPLPLSVRCFSGYLPCIWGLRSAARWAPLCSWRCVWLGNPESR